VYWHQDSSRFWSSLAGERIHRAESIEFYGLDRALLDALAARLHRRTAFDLSVAGDVPSLTLGEESFLGPLTAHRPVGWQAGSQPGCRQNL